jgi:hypothetical protein
MVGNFSPITQHQESFPPPMSTGSIVPVSMQLKQPAFWNLHISRASILADVLKHNYFPRQISCEQYIYKPVLSPNSYITRNFSPNP